MSDSNIVINNRFDCKDCMHKPICSGLSIYKKLTEDLQEITINPEHANMFSVDIVCKHLSKHKPTFRTFTKDADQKDDKLYEAHRY